MRFYFSTSLLLTFLFVILTTPSVILAESTFEHNIDELEVGSSNPETKTGKDNLDDYERTALHQILLYIPNRIFDVLDIVRIKAKVGPGFDVGIQITEPVRLYAGGHTAIYLGLPGPRQERIIPIPVGAEAKAGGALSVLDGMVKSNTGTDYSYTEIALESQLLLVGIDVGIDLVEIVDFFAGLVFLEIREDDL